MIYVIFSEHYLPQNVNQRKHFLLVGVKHDKHFLSAKIVYSIESAKYFTKNSRIYERKV